MQKYLLIILLLFPCFNGFSQVKPKQKPKTTSQSQIDKMVEDEMKGMSAEERTEVRKMMKQAAETDPATLAMIKQSSAEDGIPKIPVKQTGLLNQIPSIKTETQLAEYYNSLLAECKNKIPAGIANQVDQMIAALNGDETQMAGLLIALFLNRNTKAAVYAAVRVIKANSKSLLVVNNSAFVLQQSGYPAKAAAVFKYLQERYNTPEFNNNLAQCYLSLGDKESAKKYFRIGLAKDPHSSEMHLGLGLILSGEGNTAEAIDHIIESLKNGYSRVAEELARKQNIKIKFSDIKSKAPEYFDPQKYRPADAAAVMEDIPRVEIQREATEERYRENSKKIEDYNETLKIGAKETDLKALTQYAGLAINTPFARKARYMILLINEERFEFLSNREDIGEYKTKDDEYRKEFDAEFESIQHRSFGNDYTDAKRCAAQVESLNAYLQKSKANYENYERYVLPKLYDFCNQSLYWQSFILDEAVYKSYFNSEVGALYDALNSFKELQNLYPTPAWIYSTCKNYKAELEKIQLEQIEEQFSCPVNIKLPSIGGSSFKINCKTVELEGGELLKLGYEQDLKTGEFSLAFGLGVDATTGFLNAGAKGMMFLKFGSDFMPVDMGMKGEVGIEAQLLFLTMDEKITGTMGISSINVDAVHLGKDYNLFNVDATKD